MSNPFWEYSCAAYSQENVAALCLELQDRYGLDVNLLLYAAWLGQSDRRLSQQHLQGLDAKVDAWRTDILIPLRALRRDLKALGAGDQSYEDVKALELDAEEQQQQMMYTYHETHPIAPVTGAQKNACSLENLLAVATSGSGADQDLNDTLALLSHYLST